MAMNTPSLEELIALYKNQGANVDVPAIGKRAVEGMELQDTILKNKQGQEDRVRSLKEKIDMAKREQAQQGRVQSFRDQPSLAQDALAFPAEHAKFLRDKALQREKDTAEAAREAAKPTKGDEKTQLANDAKKTLSGLIQDVGKNFDNLTEQGGVVDVTKGKISNLMARAESSGIGQFAAGAVGGKKQSIRNNIVMSRPLLINFIRQASQMGARGLDSQKELEFYLAAATDPSRDVQANRAALARLDEAYGEGAFKVPQGDIDALKSQFQAENPPAIGAPAPTTGNPGQNGGLDAQKAARLAELRAKKAAGTLGR